jgi:hypothetical protein
MQTGISILYLIKRGFNLVYGVGLAHGVALSYGKQAIDLQLQMGIHTNRQIGCWRSQCERTYPKNATY